MNYMDNVTTFVLSRLKKKDNDFCLGEIMPSIANPVLKNYETICLDF